MNQTLRQFSIVSIVTIITFLLIFIFFPQFALIMLSLFELISILLSMYIVFRRKDVTSVKVAWVLTLYFVPVVGLFVYLFFGCSNLKSNVIQKREQDRMVRYVQSLNTKMLEPLSSLEEKNERLSKKAVVGGNQFEVLTDGEETFSAIFAALNEAKDHIHLFYFIIKEDELADKLRKILIAKASEGVKALWSRRIRFSEII